MHPAAAWSSVARPEWARAGCCARRSARSTRRDTRCTSPRPTSPVPGCRSAAWPRSCRPIRRPAAPPPDCCAGRSKRCRPTPASRPIVLAVDDAHLLDPPSAALVHLLVREGATLLGTLRTGEPVPAPIAALWTEDLLEHAELPPLTDEESRDLLATMLRRAGRGRIGAAAGPAGRGQSAAAARAGDGRARRRRDDPGVRAVALDRPARPSPRAWPTWSSARIGGLTPAVRDVLELVAFGEPLGLRAAGQRVRPGRRRGGREPRPDPGRRGRPAPRRLPGPPALRRGGPAELRGDPLPAAARHPGRPGRAGRRPAPRRPAAGRRLAARLGHRPGRRAAARRGGAGVRPVRPRPRGPARRGRL